MREASDTPMDPTIELYYSSESTKCWADIVYTDTVYCTK